jgi:hypothetical protein
MKHILNLYPSEDDILKIRKNLQDYNSGFFEIKDEPNFVISEIDESDELKYIQINISSKTILKRNSFILVRLIMRLLVCMS